MLVKIETLRAQKGTVRTVQPGQGETNEAACAIPEGVRSAWADEGVPGEEFEESPYRKSWMGASTTSKASRNTTSIPKEDASSSAVKRQVKKLMPAAETRVVELEQEHLRIVRVNRDMNTTWRAQEQLSCDVLCEYCQHFQRPSCSQWKFKNKTGQTQKHERLISSVSAHPAPQRTS